MLIDSHVNLHAPQFDEDREAVIARAREVMEGAADPAVHLSVPLVVDAGTGRNWAEAH